MIRTSASRHHIYSDIYSDDALAGADYRSDAIAGAAIGRQAVTHVKGTGSDFIDGVINGAKWQGGGVTYSFPDGRHDYGYGNEPSHQFGEVDAGIKAAAEFILDTSYGNKANDGFAVEGFTRLHVTQGSDTGATIRYGYSSVPSTSYAYFPTTAETGGDVWLGPSISRHPNAVASNYAFMTVIHETGHALGLKHGHEHTSGHPAIPHQWDSMEYSIMTYKSYVGASVTGAATNEPYGYPQTFMMADIAALQHLYGANYDVNSGDTVYSWKPGSGNTWVNGEVAIQGGNTNIFATIWDGGGRDTYDLQAYHNNVYLDLHAGSYSQFSRSQLADLDVFSHSSKHTARGNIFNALQYNDDKRSLIEDAVGGSGNDYIWGNQVGNRIDGSAGNDNLSGWQGDDTLVGGAGNDIFVFKRGWDHDTITQLDSHDRIDLRKFNFAGFTQLMAHAENDNGGVTIAFSGGDALTIDNVQVADLHGSDFIL